VRLLLDTHAYLWWLTDDPRLSEPAREAIGVGGSVVHVSAATVWEIAIKSTLGRLELGGADIVSEIGANGFSELPISAAHAAAAGVLPRVHADPFDRMLVAQSRLEGLVCVTRDPVFVEYQVPVLW
jgi:PIN domain nuclease of toxin-antitoxin system